MNRAISVHELLSTKFELIPLEGVWKRFIGQPEFTRVIFIYGLSGHGKTSLMLEMVKEFSKYTHKVVIDSLEEGKCESQRKSFLRAGMQDYADKVQLLHKENLTDLNARLLKKRAPRIVVLDSWQYVRMSFKRFDEFLNTHNNKLFIVTSHEQKGKPKGNSAEDVWYDSMIKIHVQGFIAFPRSRYGGNIPFIIWEKGARDYHGDVLVDAILEQHKKASLISN
jgi:hypothetical protein